MRKWYYKWQSMSLYEKVFNVLLFLSGVALILLLVLDIADIYKLTITNLVLCLALTYIFAIGSSWQKIKAFSFKNWYIDWILRPLYEKIFFIILILGFITLVIMSALGITGPYDGFRSVFLLVAGVCGLSAAGLYWRINKYLAVGYALLGLFYLGIGIPLL